MNSNKVLKDDFINFKQKLRIFKLTHQSFFFSIDDVYFKQTNACITSLNTTKRNGLSLFVLYSINELSFEID